MGAWGMQPFENDFALDFTAQLFHESEAGDLSLLTEAFQDVLEAKQEGYIEADLGSAAIAAAALVVALQQDEARAILKVQPQGQIWFEAARQVNYAELAPKALTALDLVLAENSELYELWEETDSFTEWLDSVKQLKAQLSAA
ncbi:MAG: DUF4259 domain-containing protein [Thiothrix sp.]|nr:MAG: DUF4259 domain-containing protein [Thiothrix sp.]